MVCVRLGFRRSSDLHLRLSVGHQCRRISPVNPGLVSLLRMLLHWNRALATQERMVVGGTVVTIGFLPIVTVIIASSASTSGGAAQAATTKGGNDGKENARQEPLSPRPSGNRRREQPANGFNDPVEEFLGRHHCLNELL